jgi:hypothetical protein
MFALTQFFHLDHHLSRLNACFTLSETLRRSAFLGDAVLDFLVTQELLCQYPTANKGELNTRREEAVCNRVLSKFLLEATDASYRLNTGLNAHTHGTIFEALLNECFTLHGMDTARSVVREYMKWVTTARETDLSTWKLLVQESINETIQELQGISEKVGQTSVPVTVKQPALAATASSSKQLSTSNACDHNQDIVQVPWLSKKGNCWHDPYFPCCGIRKGRATCLRSLWPDPTATHSGKLVIGGSRKAGGGDPQFDCNHIPRGGTPTWSCCYRTATAPGCKSGLRQVPVATIQEWLEQYAEIVEAEENVTIDSNGQATVTRQDLLSRLLQMDTPSKPLKKAREVRILDEFDFWDLSDSSEPYAPSKKIDVLTGGRKIDCFC